MRCEIKDVIIKELAKFDDDRGWLSELFRHDEIDEQYNPAMAYISMTKPGIVRGPHEHVDQTDLFCFVGPSTFRLYLWDNRKDSPTFNQSWQIDAGENNRIMAIIPAGIVHAYKNIGTIEGWVFNAPNRLYAGKNRSEPVDEIRHEDDQNSRFTIED